MLSAIAVPTSLISAELPSKNEYLLSCVFLVTEFHHLRIGRMHDE